MESINRVVNSFKRVCYSLRSLGNTFAVLFANAFNEHSSLIELDAPKLTAYFCGKCGGRLVVNHHTSSEIVYVCLGCGKIHKAKKNRVLGRF